MRSDSYCTWFVCLCVCVSVCVSVSTYSHPTGTKPPSLVTVEHPSMVGQCALLSPDPDYLHSLVTVEHPQWLDSVPYCHRNNPGLGTLIMSNLQPIQCNSKKVRTAPSLANSRRVVDNFPSKTTRSRFHVKLTYCSKVET